MQLEHKPDLASMVVEAGARHDRIVIAGALGLVTLLAWAWLLTGAGMDMASMDLNMVMPMDWTPFYALTMFAMWWIMMIAMMLPSAAPTVLLYALVNRKAEARDQAPRQPWSAAAFTSGYLAAWAGFSILAVTLQWTFERTGLLSPMMLNTTSRIMAGSILLLAGLYQFTPLKEACLRHCRGPIQFLSQTWRPGIGGAFAMGLHHGAYCLGCCWGLMAILFFGGIMNLYWIIGLALIVLIEKLAPAGLQFGKLLGLGLAAWGAWFLATAF